MDSKSGLPDSDVPVLAIDCTVSGTPNTPHTEKQKVYSELELPLNTDKPNPGSFWNNDKAQKP